MRGVALGVDPAVLPSNMVDHAGDMMVGRGGLPERVRPVGITELRHHAEALCVELHIQVVAVLVSAIAVAVA